MYLVQGHAMELAESKCHGSRPHDSPLAPCPGESGQSSQHLTWAGVRGLLLVCSPSDAWIPLM